MSEEVGISYPKNLKVHKKIQQRNGFRNVYIRTKGLGNKKVNELGEKLDRKFRTLYVQEAGNK